MSAIDVMFIRTYDGDYIADFDCNDSELPHDRNVFFYQAISAEELSALRARVAELEAELAYDGKHCPLCTWRGPVELVDGVCPQCGVDWPKLYKIGSDERQEAKSRISDLEAQVDQFHFLLVAHNAASARDLGGVIDALVKQNAQQATQLDQARDHFNAISKMPPHFTDAAAISEAIVIARDWLSSNHVSQSEAH